MLCGFRLPRPADRSHLRNRCGKHRFTFATGLAPRGGGCYGEETITETSLLEITRRHPSVVDIRTFPKQVEATNGADWERHIIGSRRTLWMRVQAKRLQRNGVLKVKHIVKSSGMEQREPKE